MNKKKVIYNIINVSIIFIAILFFIYEYQNLNIVFKNETFISVMILFITALVVHILKASRLYLILYDSNIDLISYIKIYCKVTFVSIVIPFKIGEFFRMYCYGKQLKNMLKGIIVILFDRFMDVIALITTILFVLLFNGGNMTLFVYLLLIFLFFTSVIYFAYPGIYRFWKQYLLKTKASESRLYMLKILDIQFLCWGKNRLKVR